MPELDLERELRLLGGELDVPAPPDLVPAVRARLAGSPGRVWPRRSLVLALAALAVAFAAALAVPPARTAILEFLHIRGATVERVPVPPAVTATDLVLGERVSLAEARRGVEFEPLVPDLPGLGRPDALYVDRAIRGGMLFFLYGTEERPRLLVSEFLGDTNDGLLGKLAGPETSIEPVTVGEGAGFWVAGAPHEFFLRDPNGNIVQDTVRLARNVLIWERGPLTLRIEGAIGRERALDLARSLV